MRDKGTKNRRIECPLCSFNTGLRSKFVDHIGVAHNREEQELWDEVNGGPVMCSCGCGQQTRWRGWKQGYSTSLKGHWAAGKTKDNDERVKRRAATIKKQFDSGERESWAKGKTKETDARVAKKVKATSEGLPTSWSAGKTKEAHESLKRTSESLRKVYKARRQDNSLIKGSGTSSKVKELARSEITAYVRSLGVYVVENDHTIIKPQELDIWVPSNNLAIEYNSLYWHNSEDINNKNYHQRKTRLCNMMGVKLLHVWEDEWRDRRHVIESLISARLGVGMRRVDARKCDIKPVATAERRGFFNANHLDGDTGKAKWALGLYSGDELVMCMSVRRAFHKTYASRLEVARVCSRSHVYVRGGLSRLTHHVLKKAISEGYSGLMTYVDQRLGNDVAYQKSGWQFFKNTETPRFWWSDGNTRIDRFQVRADKERGMSEREVAEEKGVWRVWGCKNGIYTMQ